MLVETDNLMTINKYAKLTDTSQPTATRWAKAGKDKDGKPISLVTISGIMFVNLKPEVAESEKEAG